MDMTTTTPKKGVLSSADFDWGDAAGPMQGSTSWTPSENAQASSQLAKILQTDSPLMTMARSGAERAAARRGLLKSSISAGAGQEAMISTATPIATADANTWAQSQRDAAQAANDFARDANSFGRQKAMTVYQGLLAREGQESDQAFRSGESALDRAFTTQRDEAGRAFTTAERVGQQNFAAGQSALDRDLTMKRDEAGRAFTAGQSDIDRSLTLKRDEAGRLFATSEREAGQQAAASEAALGRAHNEAMTRLSAQLQQDASKTNIPQAMIGDMSARMSEAVRSILADPNMDGTAKNAAIENYYKYANTQMQWMSQFYGVTTPNFMGGESFKPASVATQAPAVSQPVSGPNVSVPEARDVTTRMGTTNDLYAGRYS